MSQEERQALEDIVERMEKSYRILLKIAGVLATALIGGILFYFISFGEVKANASYAKEEISPLKGDITVIKNDVGELKGMMKVYLNNPK